MNTANFNIPDDHKNEATEKLLAPPRRVRRTKVVSESIEDPDDVWLRPLDYRSDGQVSLLQKIWQWLEFLLTLAATIIGLYGLIMKREPGDRLLAIYVASTMLSEIGVLVLVGSGMICLLTTVGGAGTAHALALCSVLSMTLQGTIYYLTVFFGVLVLSADDHKRQKTYPFLVVYVAAVMLLSFVFTLSTCSTLFGLLKFACHRVMEHLRPSVAGGTSAAPPQYVRFTPLEVYEESLRSMGHPALPPPGNNNRSLVADSPPTVAMV